MQTVFKINGNIFFSGAIALYYLFCPTKSLNISRFGLIFTVFCYCFACL